MLNHHEIYDLFNDLDTHSELWEPKIGAWRAWPAVKLMLLWRLIGLHSAGHYPNTNRSFVGKLVDTASKYPAMLSQARGQSLRGSPGHDSRFAMMCTPSFLTYPDGIEREKTFDALLSGDHVPGGQPQVFHYPWKLSEGEPVRMRGHYHLAPLLFAAKHLALALFLSPQINRCAARITDHLLRHDFPLAREQVLPRARLALAVFEANRMLMRRLFARTSFSTLVTTFVPGKMGEIAAAKELGIHVIELQHGMFGEGSSDYYWPQEALNWRNEMPLPDRYAVFGPFFANSLSQGGFWRPQDLCVVGNAAIDRYRETRHAGDAPLRLLYMSQPTSNVTAEDFLCDLVVDLQANLNAPFTLDIKLHPREAEEKHTYTRLIGKFPAICRIAAPQDNPFNLLTSADVVLSYNSLSLAEAIGLGVPCVSICDGAAPGGFAGLFHLPDITTAMPHISRPEEFLNFAMPQIRSDETRSAIRAYAERFFAPGFLNNMEEVLKHSPPSPSTLRPHPFPRGLGTLPHSG